MSDKKYPATVRLKKIWVGFALIGVLGVATVIFYNLYDSASIQPTERHTKEGAIQTVATRNDTHWYDKMQHQTNATAAGIATDANVSATTDSQHADQSLSITDPDRVKAMSAPISANQMLAVPSTKTVANPSTNAALKDPPTPYVIQAGTFIPGILITGIYSDLPGQIIGQVRANVYDSMQGRYLLIPQGSKLIGVYDAKIIYGQERVLVAWQRLILPNGQSMDLPEMAGVDNSGYAGLTDRVNAHYGKWVSSAILMSVLGAGVQWSQPQTDPAPNPMRQALSQNVASSVMNTVSELTGKNVNIQPTLEVRPGFTFNVSVTKDLIFTKAYAAACEVH